MQAVMELSGIFIKLYKNQIENKIVNNIVPSYYSVFQNKEATEQELLYAVCIFDEVLDNCSEGIFEKAFPEISKVFINQSLNHTSVDIKQSSIWGLGAFAKRANP